MRKNHVITLTLFALAGVLIGGPIAYAGAAPVALGVAGDFVILSKTGITDVPTSAVTGRIGTSPITGAADLLTCAEVTGHIYSVDAAGPKPCNIISPAWLTTAVGNMQTAYSDAAGRTATHQNLGAGSIGGRILAPGVYKWTTSVTIPGNVTFKGASNAVWILQIDQNLDISSAKSVLLTGGAQAKNIFWQVAGAVTMETGAHFQGIVLSQTSITMKTGSTITGRLLAQTAVVLQQNTVK